MIVYLSKNQVLALHINLLEATGGSDGLRDVGALDASVARPAASFGGEDLYAGVQSKASALMHSLVANHPFVDGNKRIGISCAELFLNINGFKLIASTDQLEAFTLSVADGSIGIEEIAIWIKQHSVCVDPLPGL